MLDADPEALARLARRRTSKASTTGRSKPSCISGGASNVTIGVRHRRPRTGRAPSAGRRVPADRQRRSPRVPVLRRAAATPTCRRRGRSRSAATTSVIGAPFYVMERLHGVVPHEVDALARHPRPAGAAPLCQRFVEVLAAIHAVDYRRGRPRRRRQADRLSRATGSTVDRPVAPGQGRRRPGDRRARGRSSAITSPSRRRPRSSTATTGSAT